MLETYGSRETRCQVHFNIACASGEPIGNEDKIRLLTAAASTGTHTHTHTFQVQHDGNEDEELGNDLKDFPKLCCK